MIELTFRNGVPMFTLEHFETDFADRHLVHRLARCRPARTEYDNQAAEHGQGQQHADEQQIERLDERQGVLGPDEPGAPQQHEQRRRHDMHGIT